MSINLQDTLADKYKAPLYMYNSEDYYFKDYCYFTDSKFPVLYGAFRRRLKKAFDNCMKKTEYCIYSCDSLTEEYAAVFDIPGTAVLTGTEIVAAEPAVNDPPVVSYLGNLGLGRDASLCRFAETLQKIDPRCKLQVYGHSPDQEILKRLRECAAVSLNGFVPYEETLRIMRESDLIIHAESFESFYMKDIKHGFSTKIADSLACGTPFLVYGPETFAGAKYLIKNKAAHVVTSEAELEGELEKVLKDKNYRNRYIAQALVTAEQNHRIEKNHDKVTGILNGRHYDK